MSDHIFLRGVTFYGYHGVHPEENRLGQRFVVDIDAECDLRHAGETDDLETTVSYSELYTIARDAVQGPPVKLIETVANRIAVTALERFSLIDTITVEIRKPEAPVQGSVLDHVGVRVHRRRADLDPGSFENTR